VFKGPYPSRLILVRHGETDWNRERVPQGHIDIPLNETGCRQARALAGRVCSWQVNALYSSDLKRAAQTAEILGEALRLSVQLREGWREIDVGAWGGLPAAEIRARFPEEISALERGEDISRGGGESRASLKARVVAEFERMCPGHPDETVMIVSHGGALKALIAHLVGLPLSGLDRISTRGNTGLSIFEFSMGEPRLVLLNDTSHLDGGAGLGAGAVEGVGAATLSGGGAFGTERPLHRDLQ
jgi:probable phosphoglycerate mutase